MIGWAKLNLTTNNTYKKSHCDMVNEVEPEDMNEDFMLSFVQKLPCILSKPSRLKSLEVFINFWISNEAIERHRGHRFSHMELVLNLANLANVTKR